MGSAQQRQLFDLGKPALHDPLAQGSEVETGSGAIGKESLVILTNTHVCCFPAALSISLHGPQRASVAGDGQIREIWAIQVRRATVLEHSEAVVLHQSYHHKYFAVVKLEASELARNTKWDGFDRLKQLVGDLVERLPDMNQGDLSWVN